MKQEDTVDFQIRGTWARISRIYNNEAVKFGGTMSLGYILLNIDKDGTPSTSLGPKMGMESTSLTRSLRKMEDEGLIKRVKDKIDKRRVKIHLTEEGKKMRKVSKDVVLQFNNNLRSKISKEKLAIFHEVIGELNEILDENNIFS
ncbi:MAG: DNA-binding MarR family transcriptional regulator [Patiriisocius sp.]|jgi:DNA-binding MarR family transcriptional regulator